VRTPLLVTQGSHFGADSHDTAGTDPVPCGPGLHVTSAVAGAHVPGAHTVPSFVQPLMRIAPANTTASTPHRLGRRPTHTRIIFLRIP